MHDFPRIISQIFIRPSSIIFSLVCFLNCFRSFRKHAINSKAKNNNESTDLQQNEERSYTKSCESAKSEQELINSTALPRKLCSVIRSRTCSDMPASEDDVTDNIGSAASIAERRAVLQFSGNNDWKRRVVPVSKLAETELKNIVATNNLINVVSFS